MPGSRKSFKNNVAGADKLFSVNDAVDNSNVQDTSGVSGALGVQDTSGALDASFEADIKKLKSNYRFNLKLDEGYREYIQEAAWHTRMTITEYLNNLIKEDMEKRVNKKPQN